MTSSTMSMMLTNMSGLMSGQTTLTNELSHSTDLRAQTQAVSRVPRRGMYFPCENDRASRG